MSKKDIDLNKEGEEIKETPEAAELKDDAEVKNSDAVSGGDGEDKAEKSEGTQESSVKSESAVREKPLNGRKKRFKYGALSVTVTVIFVAAIVLINIIFNMMLDRFDITADLTDNSMYSIDNTTVDYIKGIEDNIRLTVTVEESDFENAGSYYKQVSEIVKTFAANNPKITAQYLDLDSNPAFYSSYGATLTAGSIIIESEKTGRNVIITPNDYLSPKYSFNGNRSEEHTSELQSQR